MTIIPKFENIGADNSIALKPEQIAVECTLSPEKDTQSPISKVLSVTADAYMLAAEPMSGEINVSGRCDFKAMYEGTEGEIDTLTFFADFNIKPEDNSIAPQSLVKVRIFVVDLSIASVSSDEIKLQCIVEVCTQVQTRELMPVLTGGEGFFSNEASFNITTLSSDGKGICEVSEEIEVKDRILKILLSDASCIVTGVNPGVDSVSVEGEVSIRVNYLADEGEHILANGFVRILPFRHEVAVKGVMPSDRANAECAVKSLKVNALVDEDRGNSLVELISDVEIDVSVYSTSCANYADDVFAPGAKLSVTYNPITTRCYVDSFNFRQGIDGVADLDEDMPDVEKVLSSAGSRLHITNTISGDGFVTVEGVAVTTVLYCGYVDDVLRTVSANVEIPFSQQLEIASMRSSDIAQVCAIICDVDVKSRKSREIEVSMQLKLRVDVYATEVLMAISDLEISETVNEPQSSISIYCPGKGETLWDVSKQLSVSPETVKAYNPDLIFPLPDDARILVYRQKH